MASKNKPQESLDKINTVTNAWKTLRPAKTFAGLTLEQFQTKLKPSHDTRAEVDRLEAELKAAQNRRDVADEAEGDDGDLYETMGYVRKSEVRSGLTPIGPALLFIL